MQSASFHSWVVRLVLCSLFPILPCMQVMAEPKTPDLVNIGTVELQQLLESRPDTVLIDVRTADEIKQTGTIGIFQNINIPRGLLEMRISDSVISKKTPIVVYCGQNVRSPLAALTLMQMGYHDVRNYSDGYFHWKTAELRVRVADKAVESILYDLPKRVVDGVYTAIGATQPSTYENSGHNNNLSFVIADDAVVVFNAGSNYLLAQSLHDEIKRVTDLPVKYVVLENAQGHAMLGSNYWREQGAMILAHEATARIIGQQMDPGAITEENPSVYERYARRLQDKMHRTEVVMPDRTFSDRYVIPVEGRRIELLYLGASHSRDNVMMWLPDDALLITGDYAFNERLLPILPATDVRSWLRIWSEMEALGAKIVIPGHGDVTDMETIRHFTVDYLEFMVEEIMELIEAGADLDAAYRIDQSRFMQWDTFRELSKLNAESLFRKLEFE